MFCYALYYCMVLIHDVMHEVLLLRVCTHAQCGGDRVLLCSVELFN